MGMNLIIITIIELR